MNHRVELRAEPRDDAETIGTLREGTEVNVVEEGPRGWVRIESFKAHRPPGYLRRADLGRTEHTSRDHSVSSERRHGGQSLEVSVNRLGRSGSDSLEVGLEVRSHASDVLTVDRVTLVTSEGALAEGSSYATAMTESRFDTRDAARGAARGAGQGALGAGQGALSSLLSGLGVGGQVVSGAVGGLSSSVSGSYGSSRESSSRDRGLLGVALVPGGRARGSVSFPTAAAGGRELWVDYTTAGEQGGRVRVPLGRDD